MNQSVFLNEWAVILMALGVAFAFSNGYRDSSAIVATVVSTRTLGPLSAFSLCAVFEFLGALFLGSAVASTVGKKLLGQAVHPPQGIMLGISIIAIIAALLWGAISWWRAWPTSNGHALLGGLTGASWAAWGAHHLNSRTITIIVIVLMASPVLGFLISFMITGVLRWFGGWLTTRARPVTESLHVLSCLLVSCAHGSNDGQLAMGALLPILGPMAVTTVPFSLRLMVAIALSSGVLFGGHRVLKKLGMQFYRIRDPQGLSAEFTTAGTVLACGLVGFPASTTQVIAGSIMGAAANKDMKRVRWSVAHEIALSWFATFPSVALTAYLFYNGAQHLLAAIR